MSVRKTNNLQSTCPRQGTNKQVQTQLLNNLFEGKGGVHYPVHDQFMSVRKTNNLQSTSPRQETN